MAEFFLTNESVDDTTGHQIHKSNCAALPEMNTLRYLGSFASGEAAFSKSRGFFETISYCPTCFEAH